MATWKINPSSTLHLESTFFTQHKTPGRCVVPSNQIRTGNFGQVLLFVSAICISEQTVGGPSDNLLIVTKKIPF